MKNKIARNIFMMIGLLLSSCGESTPSFSLFIYNSKDTFINELKKVILHRTDSDYDVNIQYAEKSQKTQMQQINSALEDEQQKLLLVNMVDRLSASAIIEKSLVNKANVIFFNREPLLDDMDNQTNAFYIGSDNSYEGELQAKLAEDIFGNPNDLNPKYDKNGDGKIQAIILKGELGHQDAEQRSAKVISQLTEDGYDVDLINTYICNWSRTEAYNMMADEYDKIKDSVEIIFSNNDDMACGAMDYLIEKDVFKYNVDVSLQPVQLLGVDGTDVGYRAIRDGYMYGTILNDAQKQASAIIDAINYFENGTSMENNPDYEVVKGNYIYIKGSAITYDSLPTEYLMNNPE